SGASFVEVFTYAALARGVESGIQTWRCRDAEGGRHRSPRVVCGPCRRNSVLVAALPALAHIRQGGIAARDGAGVPHSRLRILVGATDPRIQPLARIGRKRRSPGGTRSDGLRFRTYEPAQDLVAGRDRYVPVVRSVAPSARHKDGHGSKSSI